MLLLYRYNLGDTLKDKVTGFQGVCLGISFYATGCVHYGLQSQDLKDQKPLDWVWVDETTVELVETQTIDFEFPFEPTSREIIAEVKKARKKDEAIKKKRRSAPNMPTPPQS